MSFDSSIVAHFGGDTTDLRSATDEASIMMKGFSTGASRAVREIGEGFVGAVVFMEAIKGIKELSGAAMEAAEQERNLSQITGQAISDQGQAWLDLHDAIIGTGGGIKDFAISAISVFPEIGDGIGEMINTLRGISPEAQTQFQSMANSAAVSLAAIKAAHDKYLADLPAAWAATNAKIANVDKQLADSEMNTQDKLDANLASQLQLKAQMAATNPSSLAYDKETLQLKQDQLTASQLQADLDKQQAAEDQRISEMALEMDKQTVQQNTEAFKTKSDTMTIEEQITALKAQQQQYNELANQDGLSEKQTAVYLAAAAQNGYDIAQRTAEIKKATALSEQDQLAMFIKETPALANLNTLSDEGLQLLKAQAQEKQTQYQIDQLIGLGVDNLTSAQDAQLAKLVQQSAELQKHIALIQGAVTAENTLTAAVTKTLNAQEQMDADQAKADSENSRGSGFNVGNAILTQSGVGGVNSQYQEDLSVRNAKANLESLQKNLSNQINGYENSDDQYEEALVPGLQAKINQLHQQEINITPSNLNGLPPTPYAPPTDNTNLTTQTTLLQGIHDNLAALTKGS